MTFEKLGPLLKEDRTPAICEMCNNYIYKRVYYDENSSKKQKTVFVCKNCLSKTKLKKFQ
ncbi:MAG: hypothetical protein KGD63_03435 [Candidatus Lokiarchaeota archaeon]|nr:hypothetical protein [Candidatus Lokiarchaeota archaeon]